MRQWGWPCSGSEFPANTVPVLSTALRIFIAALAGMLLSAPARALDPTRSISQFQHQAWTTADGMPADIWAITQTRDGYLWLASVNGLYRFDGVRIERIAMGLLPSPSIHAIAATPDGGMWIGYERPVGVISFFKNGHVRNYPIKAPSSTSVHNIVLGPDGTVWISTPDNILRFDGKAWKIVDSDWGSSLGQAGGGVWQFNVAPDGTVWSKGEHNLYYLKPGAARFVLAKGYSGGPEAFVATPEGRLATADAVTHQLYALPLLKEMPGDTIPPPRPLASVPEPVFGPILLDRNRTVWYTKLDGGGVGRTRGAGAPQFDFFAKGDGLSSNPVHTMFEDREGNIWIGTSVGLDRFTPANVVTEPGVPVGYTGRLIKATPRGLYAYTGWSNTNSKVLDGTGSLYRILPHGAPQMVVRNTGRLRGMFTNDATGEIGVISQNGVRQLKDDGTLAPPVALPEGVMSQQVYSAAEDHGGALWISVFHAGVFRQDGAGWKKVTVKPRTAATGVLIADPNGSMWVRYSGGSLFRVSGDKVDDFSNRGPPIGDITLIAPDSQGGLIIGGESGIAIYDGRDFHALRAADIPALSVVTGIARTKEGSTWIFTQAGILRIATGTFEQAIRHADPRAFRYELIDSRDGLPGAPYGAIYGSTTAAGPDGRIWFTTGNGLAWIDPGNLYHNPLPPPVVVRSLAANDRTYDFPAGLSLAAGTTKTEIEYTALSMSVPDRLHFRYKLDGVDDNWVDAGNRRQAFYTGLNPGQYRFHVVAANNDGVWNSKGATFTFSIPPTFLQSRLFLGLCVAAVAALLWFAYQLRLSQVSARLQSQLAARLAERERIARELHDTLLQGFQGLMLRFQSVADSIPADQPAHAMIESAMTRADEVLAEGRDRVHDLRGHQGGDDLPQALHDIARNAVCNEPVAFKVVIEGTPCMLHPVVCDELIQLSSEAILNAYRHAQAANIEVTLLYNRKKLQMRIRDDGIGIDRKVIETGGRPGHFGIAGMRERAKKIKAEFGLCSKPGRGTEIDVSVPATFAYARRPLQRWQFWRHASAVR
ncbi:MAG: histidine kinase [Alphaproteobacteria bacterium]|nr:histidine kinase [Alphaproteobacteria bacterium]MDB5740300.1 histidine kinase [Alphaproteobacteria bacterium]